MSAQQSPDTELQEILQGWARWLVTIVCCIALAVLIGWQFNLEFLKRPLPTLFAMNPATAVGFLLSVISFFLQTSRYATKRKTWIGYALAAVVVLGGAIKCWGIFYAVEVPVDSLLYGDKLWHEIVPNVPNRMAPSTAIGFIMTGLALLLLKYKNKNDAVPSHFFALLVLLLSSLSVVGYLYNVQTFQKLLTYIPMAIHTAICFFFLSLSILFAHPGAGIMMRLTTTLTGSSTARMFIPAALVLPVVLGYLRMLGYWYDAFPTEFGVAVLVLSIIITFLVFIWYNAGLLNKKDISRRAAEEQLSVLNTQLEMQIQELEQTKNELKESLDKEIELSEFKSRFVAIASHEFRTPLSTIQSSLALTIKYGELGEGEKQQRHIEKIKSSIAHLTYILDDFLSVSKLEEGVLVPNPVEIDIQETIAQVIADIQPLAKHEGQLRYTHSGDVEAVLDKKFLMNILLNLISNAIKFSPDEKPVLVRSVTSGGQIEISVQDNGIGISPEDQKHLFERFFRANNALHIQGTGLGLNIVAKYTELMNGHIRCLSKENKGTTFILTLPQKHGN